jgi:hypothetical protein
MDEKVKIPYKSFPSQGVSDAEKASLSFARSIGQAIQYEWFRREGGGSGFYSRLSEFHKKRLYARGEQPIEKYKNELAIDGDLSYLNLDWTPVPILPKFVDIVVNGMLDRLFEIKAFSKDALSAEHRNQYEENLERQMVNKDMFMSAKETFGIDMFTTDPAKLPADDEELQLHMQLEYKPAIEIAEEVALSTLFEKNKYEDEILPRLYYDLVNIGMCVAKQVFYPGEGVRLKYVDPAYVVHSYTEDPYFRDVFYWGEIETVPVTELYKIKPGITPDEIQTAQASGSAWHQYHNVTGANGGDMFHGDSCTLINFNYKTTKEVVYKKKVTASGGNRVVKRDDSFQPTPEDIASGRFEKISKTIDVWYEGVMVAGTDIVLKWEMAKNMVRPKSASQYAMPNYVAVAPRMYKGRVESLLGRMIPFADQIQLTHLKLQQVISRMVPDGVYIDADGLNEVDLGNGASYNPGEALKLYFQTGSVVGRSFTQDGEFNHGKVPIQELRSTAGNNKVASLIGQYNHFLSMLRDATGINEARDATDPDPRALVGIQKLAALNSNTATRHILDSGLFVTKSLAEACSVRISDILEHASYREEFANQIGKYNLRMLDTIKDLYLFDFGIFLEVSPDEEQKQALEQDIQIALSKEDINLEDAIDIREIKNIKLARQLLKVKRTRKEERDEQREMNKQQLAIKGNLEAQQMAAQTAERKIALETQGKIKVKQAESAFDIERMREEAMLKRQLMAEEFDYQMKLSGINVAAKEDSDRMKEEAKDRRIDKQSTQQSKLIEQRQKGTPPQIFESNEDSLDGFGLEEFSPR